MEQFDIRFDESYVGSVAKHVFWTVSAMARHQVENPGRGTFANDVCGIVDRLFR